MTLRQEKGSKIKKCPLCGGVLQDGTTAEPFLLKDKVIVIKDIPAEVCSDCGEAYLKSSVAGNIEKLLDELEEKDSDFSVVHYKIA